MNKALLLSVLVYPGAGHILLKKHQIGIALIALTTMALSVIFYETIQLASQIVQNLSTSEIAQLSVLQLSEMVRKLDAGNIKSATIVVLILWVIGIVDSYRCSRQPNDKTN